MSQFFIPPDFKLPVAWFADATLPVVLKEYQNIEDIIISPEDRRMLRSLRRDRLVFFTNHPSQAEPLIAYHVANVMGSRFNYMATRRAFDFLFGAVGKVFQSVGAYSIIPGIPDRDSMRMTRSILARAGGKLVLFPEGEPMCGENDNLMPFQAGIIKLSFAALADALKLDAKADITVLPGFVKYVIKSERAEIERDLDQSMDVLEKSLGLEAGGRNLLRRFLMVGRVLLEQAENEYGIAVDGNPDFDYRIGRVRHRILDNVAVRLKVPSYNTEADAIQKLRHVTAVIEMVEIGYPQKDLPVITPSDLRWANRELSKAYDFIVMHRDYLISRPTPERFYEWLARFESLVLGKKPRMLGGEPSHLPRRAHLSFAPAFHLSDYYDQYQKDKNETAERLLARLLGDMQRLLEDAQNMTYTLVAPGDIGGT
ncbi:MAG: 1-acyl-sn-glycerol-3-phosphate acyltransferase [Spirochaetales bacterium]|nr:1-acyl-sn-glycerol-3-phosphate acyltransferase [Leptospiraceae bacterium]MCP5482446.1 1-acyl-sn-glycerol-3-phosphate acyltransferase [Spirochaetales bacterium]MCP5485850.1 1-acyl-sn-glycerol-3-phosphate acyltransferase [Spirochaetales bacterium]